MSVAKNKLQDIYDEGAERLSELERAERDSLSATVESHRQSAEKAQKAVADNVKQRAQEVGAEIQAQLEQSIKRIQKAIEAESQETEKLLKRLLDGVEALAGRLNESIAEMRFTHESQLERLREEASEAYEREFEGSSSEVRRHDFSTAKNLKAQNTFAMSSFQQKLDHYLLETRGEDKQVATRLFKVFLQNANTIDSHISNSSRQLSEAFDNHVKGLEERYQLGVTGLKQEMEAVVSDAEKHATDIAQKVHEGFERISFQRKSGSDHNLAEYAEKLKVSVASAGADVSQLAESSSQELRGAALQAYEQLKARYESVKIKVEESTAALTADLNKRLEQSAVLKQELDAANHQMLEKVREELAKTKTDFQATLAATGQDALKRFSAMWSQASAQVSAGQEATEAELQAMSEKAKTQIRVTLQALLDRIKERRDAALEEVNKAAGGSPEPGEPPPNPAPARKKKKTQEMKAPADTTGGDSTGETSAEKEGGCDGGGGEE